MKVFISGYYGFENAGDEAILSGMIASLSRRRNGIKFIVASGNPGRTEALHSVRAIRHNDIRAIYEAVAEASLVIVGGGGIFQDYWGVDAGTFLTRRHWGVCCYVAPPLFAGLLGKPAVIYAVGAGPLRTRHARMLTKFACDAASVITVRDTASRDVFVSLGIDTDRITVTADPAFSLEPLSSTSDAQVEHEPAAMATARRSGGPILAVCIRQWNVGVHPEFWEREVARALDLFLAAEGGSVIFLPFCALDSKGTGDAAVSERVRAQMERKVEAIILREDLAPGQLCRLFRGVDLTLGMRLHSLVFSALNLTPAVALSYDLKVDSQAGRIGEIPVLGIDSFDAVTLAAALSHALNNSALWRSTAEARISTLRQVAASTADIALGACGQPGGLPDWWSSEEFRTLLSGGLHALLRESDESNERNLSLTERLQAVEADRAESVTFLTGENAALSRTAAAGEKALLGANEQCHALRTEIQRAADFRDSQVAALNALEAAHARSQAQLKQRLTAVEADRAESLQYLSAENVVMRERIAADEKAVADAKEQSRLLREELDRTGEFLQRQAADFKAVELERGQTREYLTGEIRTLATKLALTTRQVEDALEISAREQELLRLTALEAENHFMREGFAANENAVAEASERSRLLREELDRTADFLQRQAADFEAVELERSQTREYLTGEIQTLVTKLTLTTRQVEDAVLKVSGKEQELLWLKELHRSALERSEASEEFTRGRLTDTERRLREAETREARRVATEREFKQLQEHANAMQEELLRAAAFQQTQLRDFRRVEEERIEGREFLFGEVRALKQNLTDVAAERDLMAKALQNAKGWHQDLLRGINAYQMKFTTELAVYRAQRAWKAMLFLRKGYATLARNGWRGWAAFVGWTFTLPFSEARVSEEELRFPSLPAFLPAPPVWPKETPSVEVAADSLRSGAVLPRPAVTSDLASRQHLAPPAVYDVIVLAIIDFDFRYQRPQQIAAQFARNGHRVFWVSPTRFLPPNSAEAYELLTLRENVHELHLRGSQPDIYLGTLSSQLAERLSSSLATFCRDHSVSEHALIVQLPFWRQVALSMRETFASRVVYDCMDDWDTFVNMGDFNVSEERKLVFECDALVVTGQALVDKFAALQLKPVLVRNGADFDFFHRAKSAQLLQSIPRPVVGYFGAIADWIDLDLVRETALLRPQYSFVLVGQVFRENVAGLDQLPNVHLLGNREYGEIPQFLADFDVCTIPFLINQVTNATDPVKLYEYFSQGKPVVATAMPELAQCGDLVYIAANAGEFAACIDTALAEKDTERSTRRVEFARQNTWAERVARMDTALTAAFPLVSILIVTYNSADFVQPCLDWILQCTTWPNWEAILVDNGSADNTPELLRRYGAADSRFHVECLAENTGFAAGNNLAARRARGEYLIFLNADTMVTSGWVGRLVGHLQRDPGIGIICPVTNFAGNEIKINIAYTFVNEMNPFALAVARSEHGKLLDILVAPLYCAVITRAVWAQIGELDESFGAGMFEDDDYSLRVQRAGYRVVAAEDCFIHHFGQGSFGKILPEEYNTIFNQNRRRFEQKWELEWQAHTTRDGVKPAFEEKNLHPSEFMQR